MCKYENDYEYCIGIAHYRNGLKKEHFAYIKCYYVPDFPL